MTETRLPDFFIGGAMKSGTSTLHFLLASHPDVYMPRQELHFFSLDDIVQHPELAGRSPRDWARPDYERDFDSNLAWYEAQFTGARPDQLVGEHSTAYLASPRVAPRIARLLPRARLIFLLRDPVRRALSHYWHMVRAGRAIHTFENSLRYAPHTMLSRGFYREALEGFFRHFPREQIHVQIFEEFVADVPAAFRKVEAFLELRDALDVNGLSVHQHRGDAPLWPRLRLLQNRLLRGATTRHTAGPPARDAQPGSPRTLARRIDAALRAANPTVRRYPDARPETVAFLQDLFARENAGLAELIGQDVTRYWPYMEG